MSVADTGLGIAAEDLDRIFEEFQQAETGTRHAEGTGLGLTLSKRSSSSTAAASGATARSGVGSTFVFTLPVKGGRAMTSARILVVEDNERNNASCSGTCSTYYRDPDGFTVWRPRPASRGLAIAHAPTSC